MVLIAAFGIAWSYANQYKTDGVSAGSISASVFFIVTPSIMSGGQIPAEGFPYVYLGSRGLFVAFFLGLLRAWICTWFINNTIQIHRLDTVPPTVAQRFPALIPGPLCMFLVG
ncbi:PTS transporter subunit EIIC, partial [Lactobacillus johnsonii]|uniref:PTS transporter subunit EIIC n=1 Tax=Lactobacillus johnsonii TaxID=33959 RepID=UPI0011D061E8